MGRAVNPFLLLFLCSILSSPLLAERLDDSLSPQQQVNLELDWKFADRLDRLDERDFNTVVAHARNLDTRLDTSMYLDRNVRIFLNLPIQIRGLINPQSMEVSWTTNGLFQSGRVTPGNRRLIFEGTITESVMRDIFNFTFEVDARYLTQTLRLEPIYEIELVSP